MKTNYNEIPLLPGNIYHIYNHANGFENLFVRTENYHYFLKKYAEHLGSVADTFAYCLMPNHFHLLVRIRPLEQLSESFKLSESSSSVSNQLSKRFSNFFSSYAQAFNKQQNRRGSLFVSNFKRKEVSDDWYFGRLAHYIHFNPVKDGFVSHPAEWPHSSFMSLLSEKPTRLLRKELMTFFGDRNAFLQAHNLEPDDQFLKIIGEWF